jgi:probable addiction module antidote protein
MKRKASVSYDEAIIRQLWKDPDFAAEYLKAALEDEDELRVLVIALHHLAQAQGIAKVANAAGIERENLYRALSVHGKLAHSSNLKGFENAIEILEIVRFSDEDDSRADKVRAPLRMIYGSEKDGAPPYALRQLFVALWKLPSAPQEEENTEDSADPIRFMCKAIDKEMLRLAMLHDAASSVERLIGWHDLATGLVPPQEVSDRVLRYEAHRSREFDRTLSQLECLQRMRVGQPVPPPIRLDLSS